MYRRAAIALVLVPLWACDDIEPQTDPTDDPGVDPVLASPGCGVAPAELGVRTVELDLGPDGDGVRAFTLSVPEDYDPDTPHRVILGYPGTNWRGSQIRPYLALEGRAGDPPTIFAYPDPLWRDFDGWGNLGGWVLGPHASPADGDGDLVFTEAILDHLEQTHCVDTARVFATGHSWGGDMAQVVACFLGDRITASVPIAANRPYWFETGSGPVECVGDAAVWTLFGVDDTHFSAQPYPGAYGDECRDFWVEARGCDGVEAIEPLPWGEGGDCVRYTGCAAEVRYCLYGAEFGHQRPDYFADAALDWFAEI